MQKKRDELQAFRPKGDQSGPDLQEARIVSWNDPIPNDYRAHEPIPSKATDDCNLNTFALSESGRNQNSGAGLFTAGEHQMFTQDNVGGAPARSSYIPPVIVSSSPVQCQTLHQRDISMVSASTFENFP